jgi:hypothetical protein
MSAGAVNVRLSNSAAVKRRAAMNDCGRYVMCATPCTDCVIAVTETRNVTGRLGRAERRALQVLAEAGLVPAHPAAYQAAAAFPHAKAS